MRLPCLLLVLALASNAAADTHAWFASVPRADWPCAILERHPDGDRALKRFRYGAVKACKLPIEYAEAGVVGCPTRTTEGPSRASVDSLRFTYKAGRLVAIQNVVNGGTSGYDWKTGEPYNTDQFEREIEDGVIQWVLEGKVSSRITVDAKSRPIGATSFDVFTKDLPQTGSSTYEWEGDRLLRIRFFTVDGKPTHSKELLYDCRKLAKE